MSDDDVEVLDDSHMDDAAVEFGEAEEFDPVTGMPVARAGSRVGATETSSYMSTMPTITTTLGTSWQRSLAEKNASNTADLNEPHMVGIDEAGRGPVLGSMVYGVAWCPINKLDALRAIKVADSKTLTLTQRQGLFSTIQSTPWLGYEVDVILPERLSRESLRRTPVNLNVISHDSAIGLIQAVIKHGVNVREVYVDTVGDAGKYQEKLSGIFPGISITVTSKADSLFPIVSAASIAAKVTRDLHLEEWEFAEERAQPNGVLLSAASYPLKVARKFGSGYPGDPATKIWLQNHLDPIFGYPDIVRFSWGTTKKILKSDAVQVEWGDEDSDDEDGEGGGSGSQKMGQFFAAKEKSTSAAGAKEKALDAADLPGAASLVTGAPTNNKRFTLLHDGLTHKQRSVPQSTRVAWFQQHQMHVATMF